MGEKALTGLQLEYAQELSAEIFTDFHKQAKFIAVSMASNDVLRKARTNPDVLLPLIEQAEDLDNEVFANKLHFFMACLIEFRKIYVNGSQTAGNAQSPSQTTETTDPQAS